MKSYKLIADKEKMCFILPYILLNDVSHKPFSYASAKGAMLEKRK